VSQQAGRRYRKAAPGAANFSRHNCRVFALAEVLVTKV
jgi:hypothetical protein